MVILKPFTVNLPLLHPPLPLAGVCGEGGALVGAAIARTNDLFRRTSIQIYAIILCQNRRKTSIEEHCWSRTCREPKKNGKHSIDPSAHLEFCVFLNTLKVKMRLLHCDAFASRGVLVVGFVRRPSKAEGYILTADDMLDAPKSDFLLLCE